MPSIIAPEPLQSTVPQSPRTSAQEIFNFQPNQRFLLTNQGMPTFIWHPVSGIRHHAPHFNYVTLQLSLTPIDYYTPNH